MRCISSWCADRRSSNRLPLTEKVHALRIGTPAGDVIFDKDGLYRLEAQPSAVYLAVHEGKAKWLKEGGMLLR
jgi:hypothetical protein